MHDSFPSPGEALIDGVEGPYGEEDEIDNESRGIYRYVHHLLPCLKQTETESYRK